MAKTHPLRWLLGPRAGEPQAVAPAAGGNDVDLADLLGRPAVSLDTPELQRFIAGQVVLVTGAGGSIGSEICRQCMRFCPRQLILLDRAENALFEIDRELRHRWVAGDIVPVVADIGDRPRIGRIFSTLRPRIVFHAAAHKHVPMMEHNPGEAVKNNILGTRTVADAAIEHGTAAFVMVSTDKAVNPSSVMGAAKRMAELYIQSLAAEAATGHKRTRFVAVRFGNVLGSSGSVVPIFRKQIEAGGPVTVTHPDMRRFFMTIPEASQLVMQAGAIGQGGEVFVLDMGQPIRILDLANHMIGRASLTPGRDIAIEFTGVRPGEKLEEELAADNEQTRPTAHAKIRVWQLPPADPEQVRAAIGDLAEVMDGPREQVIAALRRAVPEYQPEAARRAGADRAELPTIQPAAEPAFAPAAAKAAA
jgi:FlaA1/EpsC-like NDP-sugar epimerase